MIKEENQMIRKQIKDLSELVGKEIKAVDFSDGCCYIILEDSYAVIQGADEVVADNIQHRGAVEFCNDGRYLPESVMSEEEKKEKALARKKKLSERYGVKFFGSLEESLA